MADSLVSIEEFERRVPEAAAEPDRALAELESASALVRSAAGLTASAIWGASVAPDVVVAIVIDVARRAFRNPDGLNAHTLGPESVGYSDPVYPGVFLTALQYAALRRAAGLSGIWTLSTTRAENDVPDVPSVAPWALPVGDADIWDSLGTGD